MKNEPENELLSAYLDGELTAEEQAEVERLLAADPAARQLVDELRALSSSLQALPSHEIGESIRDRVLHQAERRMLSEPAPERPDEREPAGQAVGPPWRAILRRVARPRNLAWSGVAVAVAILIMVFSPPQAGRRDRGPVAWDAPAASEESTAASRGPGSIRGVPMAADESGAEEPSPPENAVQQRGAMSAGVVTGMAPHRFDLLVGILAADYEVNGPAVVPAVVTAQPHAIGLDG